MLHMGTLGCNIPPGPVSFRASCRTLLGFYGDKTLSCSRYPLNINENASANQTNNRPSLLRGINLAPLEQTFIPDGKWHIGGDHPLDRIGSRRKVKISPKWATNGGPRWLHYLWAVTHNHLFIGCLLFPEQNTLKVIIGTLQSGASGCKTFS